MAFIKLKKGMLIFLSANWLKAGRNNTRSNRGLWANDDGPAQALLRSTMETGHIKRGIYS